MNLAEPGHRALCAALFLFAAVSSACSADTAPGAQPLAASEHGSSAERNRPLLDHSQWQAYDRALDPLASHQPAQVQCGLAGWLVEYGGLEVDTARCNYLLVQHPAQIAVARGTPVFMELRYFELTAPQPAQAHLAVLFGDDLQWQTTIDIPGPASVLTVTWLATRTLQVGEPIRLHLHNHGQNTWLLAGLWSE